MKRIFIGMLSILAVLATTSCSPTPSEQLSDLQSSIAAGTDCPELFPQLKAIPSYTTAAESAQAEMRNIGCFTRSSERTDAKRSANSPGSAWIGVPNGKRVEVSPSCLDVVQAGSDIVDSDSAEGFIVRSLVDCSDTDEWLSALQQYPGLMGMVDNYIPSVTDIQVACMNYPNTRVCIDARKRGL